MRVNVQLNATFTFTRYFNVVYNATYLLYCHYLKSTAELLAAVLNGVIDRLQMGVCILQLRMHSKNTNWWLKGHFQVRIIS